MSHPESPSRSGQQGDPSRILVLSAIERAERHRQGGTPGVSVRAVLAHLGSPPRSVAARAVRLHLETLLLSGSVQRDRRRGREVWALTRAGSGQLRRAERSGRVGELPESPQHRAWRTARTMAGLELERFRSVLAERLLEACELLAADPQPPSDAWLELAEALSGAARRVGAASHCLHEWREPDDARADVDERDGPGDRLLDPPARARIRALRAGRRNIRLWDDRAARLTPRRDPRPGAGDAQR